MSRPWRALLALLAVLLGRRGTADSDGSDRIVPETGGDPRAELLVILLLVGAALSGVAFVVIYAFDDLGGQTQLLGIALGVCLALIAAALILAAKRLVPYEEIEDDYPVPEHPEDQEAIAQLARESAAPITRKRLLGAAGGAAGSALLLAAVTPALSLGPWLDTDPLYRTPWRRGRRLVDDAGVPLRADAIETETFYTAFPEGADRDELGSPVVVVRVDPAALRLPGERRAWAPLGILAYSKICTHAGCAVSLYRKPTFPPTQPRPALVCPCHYSTFDPAAAGEVLFGPAGRPLPQLPLEVDAGGDLRAAGNYSGPVGAAWQGVRGEGPSS